MGGVPSKPDPSRTLEVIDAGYSRTGTLSMQIALEKLLDGPVQHGATHLLASKDWCRLWYQAMAARRQGDKESAMKLIREVTAGYVGVSDIPGCLCVSELLEIYPDAKVVLVTRDPQKWWKSYAGILDHVDAWFVPFLTLPSPGLRWFPPLLRVWKANTNEFLGGTPEKPAEFGPAIIEDHNRRIIETVPKEKLLVMDLKEGWEPLCKFLGKPIPNEPFPRANDAEAADKVAARVFGKLALVWLGIISAIGGSIYVSWHLGRGYIL